MKKNSTYGLAALAVGMLTTACNDDLGSSARYNDGMLHFMFTMDDDLGQWADGNTTRMGAPIAIATPEGVSDTLYLHCEETLMPTPLPSPATRGRRLTGEVFGNGINTFGLYARIDGTNTVVSPYDHELRITDDNFQTVSDDEGEWRAKEGVALDFPGDQYWRDQTVSFYGFAPFPGDADDEARCISVADDATGQPTLTFRMLADETQDKDILTACATGVTKTMSETDGIELRFHHVLSALKFRFADDGNSTTDDVTARINGTDYYIKVTAIALDGIYSEGSCPITDATPTWTPNGPLGSCTITTPRQHADMAADHLLNTDAHCLMVMPQQTPADARLTITCDLYDDYSCTGTPYKTGATFTATVGTQTWEPGHSYTYTMSKNAIVYNAMFSSRVTEPLAGADVIEYNVSGGSTTLMIKSAKERLTANQAPGQGNIEKAPFHVEYSEFVYSNPDNIDDHTGEWSEWTSGVLPYGYYLEGPDGKTIRDLTAIKPTTTAEQEYKLVAAPNVAYPNEEGKTKTIMQLRKKYFEPNSADGYYDLSYQFNAAQRNTANCYMIDGYGKFKIPLVYGNAIREGRENPAAYSERTLYPTFINYKADHIRSPYIKDDTGMTPATADIVWEDEFNLIDSYDLDATTDHGYLRFEIKKDNIRPGNAILCVKDAAGDIMWSWHIWVTDKHYDPTDGSSGEGYVYSDTYSNYLNITPWNLGKRERESITTVKPLLLKVRFVQNETGATESHDIRQNDGTVTFGASSLYYQYGRKDPMPAQVVGQDYVEKIRDLGYTWQVEGNIEDNTLNTGVDMSEAIKHPNYLYVHRSPMYYGIGQSIRNGNWCCIPHTKVSTYGGCRQWSPRKRTQMGETSFDVIKTVYDPCPVGFTVPPLAFAYAFEGTNFAAKGGEGVLKWYEGTRGSTTFKFPMAGDRTIEGTVEGFNTKASIWTTGTMSYTDGGSFVDRCYYAYGFFENVEWKIMNDVETTHAMSIRPVVEKHVFEELPSAAELVPDDGFVLAASHCRTNRSFIPKNQDNASEGPWAGPSAIVFDYYGNIDWEQYDFIINLYLGGYSHSYDLYNYELSVEMNNHYARFTMDNPTIPSCNNNENRYNTAHVAYNVSQFGFESNADFIKYMREHPDELVNVTSQRINNSSTSYKEVRLAKMDITVKPKN